MFGIYVKRWYVFTASAMPYSTEIKRRKFPENMKIGERSKDTNRIIMLALLNSLPAFL